MELRAGILMIGSLYWDEARDEWRRRRLVVEGEHWTVRAPIRYGRLSAKRGNTYTMVFSPNAGPGTAKVMPCRGPIHSAASLIEEAAHLWAAESRQPAPNGATARCHVSSIWGSVAVLANPASEVPAHILEGWERHVAGQPHYGSIPAAPGESDIVDRAGRLQIRWPRAALRSPELPFDLLLATPTHPHLSPHYPAPAAIAAAWKDDPHGHVEYFHNNRASSIHTFEDEEIEQHLTGS